MEIKIRCAREHRDFFFVLFNAHASTGGNEKSCFIIIIINIIIVFLLLLCLSFVQQYVCVYVYS